MMLPTNKRRLPPVSFVRSESEITVCDYAIQTYKLMSEMNRNALRDLNCVFTVKCKPVSPGEPN